MAHPDYAGQPKTRHRSRKGKAKGRSTSPGHAFKAAGAHDARNFAPGRRGRSEGPIGSPPTSGGSTTPKPPKAAPPSGPRTGGVVPIGQRPPTSGGSTPSNRLIGPPTPMPSPAPGAGAGRMIGPPVGSTARSTTPSRKREGTSAGRGSGGPRRRGGGFPAGWGG